MARENQMKNPTPSKTEKIMTVDFSIHQDSEKKWIRTGIAAIFVIVLIIPLA